MVWPSSDCSSDVKSNERLFGPTCCSGSPGFVENTSWSRPPEASRTSTRHSWLGSLNTGAKLRIRSCQLSTADATFCGTTMGLDRMCKPGPLCDEITSKLPDIGGNTGARLGGTNVPLLIAQLPEPLLKTVQPVR